MVKNPAGIVHRREAGRSVGEVRRILQAAAMGVSDQGEKYSSPCIPRT